MYTRVHNEGMLAGMKRALAFALVLVVASAAAAETITVAAAISLKDALAKAAERYRADTGESVELTVGSSGQLASQIANGAPVDLFLSAANKQVDELIKQGVLDEATRKVVAGNALVLVVPADAKSPPASLKELAQGATGKVAIGEPRSVPAGQYAEQALKSAGVAEALKDRLVLGTNVRQVLDYVERGEVSAGLVYATDVVGAGAKAGGAKVRVACEIAAGEHEPIVYPAAVVKASRRRAAAAKFLDYLASEKGQACLKEFGFTPPPPQNSRK